MCGARPKRADGRSVLVAHGMFCENLGLVCTKRSRVSLACVVDLCTYVDHKQNWAVAHWGQGEFMAQSVCTSSASGGPHRSCDQPGHMINQVT